MPTDRIVSDDRCWSSAVASVIWMSLSTPRSSLTLSYSVFQLCTSLQTSGNSPRRPALHVHHAVRYSQEWQSVYVRPFMSPCHVLDLLFRSWGLWDSADQCPSEHGGGSVSYWSCQLSRLHLSAGSAPKACCSQRKAGKGCWQFRQGMSVIVKTDQLQHLSAVNSVKKASAQKQIWDSALSCFVSCSELAADCH